MSEHRFRLGEKVKRRGTTRVGEIISIYTCRHGYAMARLRDQVGTWSVPLAELQAPGRPRRSQYTAREIRLAVANGMTPEQVRAACA